jgi:hypothetical protein
MKFESQALKRFTEEQIQEALFDPFLKYFDMEVSSRRGFPRRMYVGTTIDGVVIEIGVEFRDDDDYIFHSMKARKATIREAKFSG